MTGPYVALERHAWAALADATQIDLDEATLARLRGIGDPTSSHDITEVYRPLTQLLHLYMENTGRLYAQSNGFLGLDVARVRHGHARRVISAVLEPAQAAQHHIDSVTLSDISHDSTHAENRT